jgi:N-acetylneuraminic acid mutarotase
LDDTWASNGAAWTNVTGAQPPGRYKHAMATLGTKIVLFGGEGSSVNDAGSPISPYLGDTWTFDGTTWAPVNVTGPSARTDHTMAALNGKVVLFGGYSGLSSDLNDTWTFDGTTWSQVTPTGAVPPARAGHAMATLNGKIVVFGGTDGSGYLGDTWAFDGTSWTQVPASGAAPSARYHHAMATLP